MRPAVAPLLTRPPAVLAGVAVVAAAGLYFVNPNTTHVPLCPLHAMTGLWCPLCGATRAAYALLHRQFGTALHDNGFVVLGLPLVLLLWWRWSAGAGDGRLLPRWLFWTVVVLGLIFGVVRNLPTGAGLAPPG